MNKPEITTAENLSYKEMLTVALEQIEQYTDNDLIISNDGKTVLSIKDIKQVVSQ